MRAPRTQRMYAGPIPSGTRSHSPRTQRIHKTPGENRPGRLSTGVLRGSLRERDRLRIVSPKGMTRPVTPHPSLCTASISLINSFCGSTCSSWALSSAPVMYFVLDGRTLPSVRSYAGSLLHPCVRPLCGRCASRDGLLFSPSPGAQMHEKGRTQDADAAYCKCSYCSTFPSAKLGSPL